MKYYKSNIKELVKDEKEAKHNQKKFQNSKKLKKNKSGSKRDRETDKPNSIKISELKKMSFHISKKEANQNEEKKLKNGKDIYSSKQIKENNENNNKKIGFEKMKTLKIKQIQKKIQNDKNIIYYREEKKILNEYDLNLFVDLDIKIVDSTKFISYEEITKTFLKIDINKCFKNKTIQKILKNERTIIYYLIILLIFSVVVKSNSVDQYITLKIGKGRNKVLGDEDLPPYSHPSEVYINGDIKPVQNYYTFTLEENTVK